MYNIITQYIIATQSALGTRILDCLVLPPQGLNAVFDILVIGKVNVLEIVQKALHKDKSLEVSVYFLSPAPTRKMSSTS